MKYGGSRNRKMSLSGRKRLVLQIRAFFFVIFLICVQSVSVQGVLAEDSSSFPEELVNLHARSAVLMDADSMRVLVSREGDVMRPMASTTKIMTCILALEDGDLDAEVTASTKAASQPKVHLGMREGEKFRLGDLLYSLMLESHNDSAVAIAEHLAGSVPDFADKMNEKAREIGCLNAHFVSPNGLDDQDEAGVHSISAADLARIMSYCITKSPKSEEFLEITQTRSYQFSDLDGKRNFSCGNHNLFLDMMEGAISGKTGFTGDAGYCYVGALKRDGKTFVVALLACGWPNNKNYKWADTKALMNYGLSHYEYRNIRKDPQLLPIWVENGIPRSGDLFEEAQIFVEPKIKEEGFSFLLGDAEEVEVRVEQKKRLEAPVKKGETAGSVSYYLGEQIIKEYDLVTSGSVMERSLKWYFEKMFEKYMKFQLIY